MPDFIGEYEAHLSPDICKSLIKAFNADQNQRPGVTGQGIDKVRKDSSDITLDRYPAWGERLEVIHDATLKGLIQYARTYPHLVIGALALNWTPPGSDKPRSIAAEDIKTMDDSMLFDFVSTIFRTGTTNLQKYKKGTGGYHHWHSEHYPSPHDPSDASLHRVLLWMYYLNDVTEGGGTSFYYQDKTIAPQEGKLVIAPAGFTHTHRGEVPLSNDKYILTSWIMFKDRKTLYGLS